MGLTVKKAPGIVVGYNFKKAEGVQISAPESKLLPIRVMGVDVSTDTGVVVLQWDIDHGVWRTVDDFEINLPSLPKKSPLWRVADRWVLLQTSFLKKFQEHCPALVAIEGYGYANANSLVTLVELGAALRGTMSINYLANCTLEVAPASLKKFILGKGVGKKEQVMMQVFKKWGYEAKTNNLADAYVLAHIAAASYLGGGLYKGLTKPQKEVLAVVMAKNT